MLRWNATVFYRTASGSEIVECDAEEIGDIEEMVERGKHFDTVEGIFIKRINHVDSPTLTVEQAEAL